MKKWRIIVGFFAVVLLLANLNILGFHQPASPLSTIILIVGLAIITCVCDAVEALAANRR